MCVEPDLREKAEGVAPEKLDPETRRNWELHLEICHDCREKHAFASLEPFNKVVGELLAEGVGINEEVGVCGRPFQLAGGNGSSQPRLRRHSFWLGATAAAAAAIVLALALPPNPKSLMHPFTPILDEKAPDISFLIKRPLEGEVLLGSGGELEWTSVERARFYRVTLRGLRDDFNWTKSVNSTTLDLPEGSEALGDYLAIVEPLPEGLIPEKDREVLFRRGGPLAFLAYRLEHMPVVSLLLIFGSLILGSLAVFRRQ